jgi:trk system potassium uptake protein TrkA
VFIIGGGMISFYLAKRLKSSKSKLKIVENDFDRCKMLADVLDGVSVVYGNGTDEEVLLEEGLSNSDACIAVTGNDEENVIVSLYAKQIGVPKVITKVDSPTITSMLSTLDELQELLQSSVPVAVSPQRKIRYSALESEKTC